MIFGWGRRGWVKGGAGSECGSLTRWSLMRAFQEDSSGRGLNGRNRRISGRILGLAGEGGVARSGRDCQPTACRETRQPHFTHCPLSAVSAVGVPDWIGEIVAISGMVLPRATSFWIFNREWTPIDANEVKIIRENDLL